MATYIAFCTNAVVFHQNQILDQECTKKYPGSEWIYFLYVFAKEKGIEVVTGDVALMNVYSKKWSPTEILIIQEEMSTHGDQLIKIGAKPFLLFCLESPVYAREFYSKLFGLSKSFKNRILFRGIFEKTALIGLNHIAYFPSFSESNQRKNSEWKDRKFLVMVAANKYWKIIRPFHRQVASWIRDLILQKKSHLTPELIAQQLHDKRLELIEYFGKSGDLDLFGGGWGNLSNLPRPWPKKLKSIIDKLDPKKCNDKLEVISNYKFAICFENMSFPGYVTEKIIDCFSAGVIPIYLGAPDISEFVPKNLYIDLRDFQNPNELSIYIKSLSNEKALRMISAGHAFLESSEGKKFSFENLAKNVLMLAENM